MVSFAFRINRSFLNYPSHPITVPKSQVDYAQVRDILGAGGEAWVGVEGQGSIPATVYNGVSGYGEYFQIRLHQPIEVGEEWLSLHRRVEVRMLYTDGRVEIAVRPWGKANIAA